MERELVARGAVHALDRERAEALAQELLAATSAGAPVPALSAIRAEARGWAAMASRAELRTYAAAALERLKPADRAELIDAFWHAEAS